MAQPTKSSSVEKDQNVKTMAALAYIIFFIPMITNKDSKFAMYHANQGLVLLLTVIVLNIVVGFFGAFILWGLPGLVGIVFAVLGIMNALNGKAEPLPVIGGITLIK